MHLHHLPALCCTFNSAMHHKQKTNLNHKLKGLAQLETMCGVVDRARLQSKGYLQWASDMSLKVPIEGSDIYIFPSLTASANLSVVFAPSHVSCVILCMFQDL